MTATAAAREQILRTAAEAASWRMISLLFSYPAPPWRESVRRLLPDLRDAELRQAASLALEQASESAYVTLFGPGGPLPIREAACRRGVELGNFLAEIVAFYELFGYDRPPDEPPDHLAVEADFLAFLRLKEAYALANENLEGAKAVRDAAQRFAAEHVAGMAVRLARMLDGAEAGYLGLAARAMARLAPASAEPPFPVLRDDEEESFFACGGPD